MHGARLADEARSKVIHHTIGLHQSQPEFVCKGWIILRMDAVAIERDRVLDFTRHGPDVDVDAETAETLHEFVIEVGYRHRFEGKMLGMAITGFNKQPVIDEVKDDIERSPGIGHRWRRKPAGGH